MPCILHVVSQLQETARVCRSRPVQPSENKPPRLCTATLQSDIPLSQDAGLSNSDRIRMCVDLSHLNRYVKRERYQSPTLAEAIADISACQTKFFTVLDAMNGYHQCPLNQESQLSPPYYAIW